MRALWLLVAVAWGCAQNKLPWPEPPPVPPAKPLVVHPDLVKEKR